ncbi:MAG: ClpXP protease specificity-enhancing factor [Proteobacteria bacterium]|nr:ClpXP protease specificity-enhancing factor [Pseudomonadota bacterium]
MKPRRPYLLRALHEWITDSGDTPHIVVDATNESVIVPRQYVKDGKIVLNVSFSAAHGLKLGNEFVTFDARFGGSSFNVSVPLKCVLGIYSRETGQGMIFAEGDADPDPNGQSPTPPPAASPADSAAKEKRARFKVVK